MCRVRVLLMGAPGFDGGRNQPLTAGELGPKPETSINANDEQYLAVA
jgi:hypothetical protein